MESQKNYHDKIDSSLFTQEQNKDKPLTFLHTVKFLHKKPLANTVPILSISLKPEENLHNRWIVPTVNSPEENGGGHSPRYAIGKN